MKLCCVTLGVLVVFSASFTNAQLPPRYSIPGAILVPQGRPPNSFRQGRLLAQEPQPQILQRPRRPNPTVRPVIEESIDQSSSFEDEVNKPFPTTIQFRPERPVPVLKQDIRDNYPSERPALRPIARQQEYREPQPIRTPQRQPVQQSRPAARIPARPLEDGEDTRRKNHITWGFENEDGTFKEENIGVDCIIRGKYGYVDPDGVKREYSYESGNPCDKPEEEEDLPPQIPDRRDQFQPQGKKIQYRPISQ
ncbi:hypothetical protein WA026_005832 [Henosepilachna vigintioctopunctata]|uniref:Uncharacterized protein n=1 Tax=Henosepilachna vigintioctopunctata TaxID=420089 RepID=A0AAW1TU06_9CUCU